MAGAPDEKQKITQTLIFDCTLTRSNLVAAQYLEGLAVSMRNAIPFEHFDEGQPQNPEVKSQ